MGRDPFCSAGSSGKGRAQVWEIKALRAEREETCPLSDTSRLCCPNMMSGFQPKITRHKGTGEEHLTIRWQISTAGVVR